MKIAKDGIALCQFGFRTPNVLPFVGGLKIFGIDGVQVKVSEIEYTKLDASCTDFENLSQ